MDKIALEPFYGGRFNHVAPLRRDISVPDR
jgi:hypothetical protein